MKRTFVFAVLVLSMATSGFSGGKGGGKKLTVDVIPDGATFSFVDLDGSGDPTAGEPFLVEGDIFKKDGLVVIGHFLCRGFFIVPQGDGDSTFVHQSFEIDGKGTIHIEGNEPGAVHGVGDLSRAIVGATGKFKGSGEAVIRPLAGGAFRATFRFKKP